MGKETKIEVNKPSAKKAKKEEAPAGADKTKAAKKVEKAREPAVDPLAAAEAQAREYHDRWLRASAELENVKKRAERDRSDYLRYANEGLLKECLGVADNLCRALEQTGAGEEVKALKEGIQMTLDGLLTTLTRYGVKEVESIACAFDPNIHEAVSVLESDEADDNTVTAEIQKGYLLHDRLLRPSLVVVNRRPSGGDEGDE